VDRGGRRLRRSPDAKSRHAVAGAAHVAGLEVEEAFEERCGAGPVGLALAAIHHDDARRPRTQVIRRSRGRATAAWRAITPSEPPRGRGGLRLGGRARRAAALGAAAAPAPAARPATARIVLQASEPR